MVNNDCKTLLIELNLIFVVHVPRSANQSAHILARATDYMTGLCEWMSSPPDILLLVLSSEV